MPYTQVSNLDFENIKTSLKEYLRSQNDFTDYDFEGSALATLVDTLAYNTYYTAFNTNMVVNEVTKVRPSVSLSETSITPRGSILRIFRRFSRMRSDTTMVSLSEYPITARMAAKTDRSNSKRVIEKNPRMISTSCASAITAPMANLIWKRKAT